MSSFEKTFFYIFIAEPFTPMTLRKMENAQPANRRRSKFRKAGAMLQKTRDLLDDFYKVANSNLINLIGDVRFTWQ